MRKTECPACAMQIDARLKTCPICQYEFPKTEPAVKWVALILIVVLIATLIIVNFL